MTHDTKEISTLGSPNFARISATSDSGTAKVDIFKDGTLAASTTVDLETEGVKDAVASVFNYNLPASEAWHARQDPEDFDFNDPAPIDPDNIDYDIDKEIEDEVYENMNNFPGERAEKLIEAEKDALDNLNN